MAGLSRKTISLALATAIVSTSVAFGSGNESVKLTE